MPVRRKPSWAKKVPRVIGEEGQERVYKPRVARPEQAIQIGIFNHLRKLMELQKYGQFMAFHVGNGVTTTKRQGSIFKSMGVMPGVADIILLLPAKETPGPSETFLSLKPRMIFIELKAASAPPVPRFKKDGSPYKERARDPSAGQDHGQKAFQERVTAMGFDYRLLQCRDARDGLNEVLEILRACGVKF